MHRKVAIWCSPHYEAIDSTNYFFHPKLLFMVNTDTTGLGAVVVQQAILWTQKVLTSPTRSQNCKKSLFCPRTRVFCCVLGPWKLVYLQGKLFIVAMDHSFLHWVLKPLKTQHPNPKSCGLWGYGISLLTLDFSSSSALKARFPTQPLQLKESHKEIQQKRK